MKTSHVHPRLGYPNFIRFEPYFLAALRAWPKETVFELSGGLSPTTIAARMRDSLQGYRINRWAQVDPEFVTLYDKFYGQFVISLTNDSPPKVLFKHRQKTGGSHNQLQYQEAQGDLPRYMKAVTVVGQPEQTNVTRIQSANTEQIKALAALRSSGALTDPVIFSGDIRSSLTSDLESSLDLSFHFDPQRNETIMM